MLGFSILTLVRLRIMFASSLLIRLIWAPESRSKFAVILLLIVTKTFGKSVLFLAILAIGGMGWVGCLFLFLFLPRILLASKGLDGARHWLWDGESLHIRATCPIWSHLSHLCNFKLHEFVEWEVPPHRAHA